MLTPSERTRLEEWIIANDDRLSEQNAETGDAMAQAWEALNLYFTEDLYGKTRRRLRDAGITLKHWGWKNRPDPEAGLIAPSIHEAYTLILEIWDHVPLRGGIAMDDLWRQLWKDWRRVAYSAIRKGVADPRSQCYMSENGRVYRYRKADPARPETLNEEG